MRIHHPTRRAVIMAGAATALGAAAQRSNAQTGVSGRPVRLVVPFPPGGTTDTLARLLAPRLATRLGQPVIVDNKAGAATQMGAMEVVKAAADGLTLILTGPSTFTATPAVNPRTPYDPVKSFDHIGLAGSMPMVLLAHPGAPFHDIASLVATARREPGKHFYGTFGSGSIAHFAGEIFSTRAGIKLEPVPYKGSAPAMTDLIGGQIPLSFDTVVAASPYVKAAKVRALAVTAAHRSMLLPDVPTMAEAGYAMDISSWLGIAAPAGLSSNVKARLEKAVADTVDDASMREAMLKIGIEAAPLGAKAFAQKVREEYAVFRKIAIDNDIKPD